MEPINVSNSGLIQNPLQERKKTGKSKDKRKISFSDKLKDASETRESETLGTLEASVDEPLEELLDDVHMAGDDLRKNPVFENIKKYRQAVQRFLRFVVDNSYAVSKAKLSRFQVLKRKGQPELTLITVVNNKLDALAAGILQNQLEQLEVLARVEEINGLLVDLIG
jgi:uncharacterized protein